ncbi:gene transfer agent family protein [Methylorubrum zatmanii]
MKTDTSATALYADFAGRTLKFELRIGEIGELERRCGAGIGEIMVRLAAHRFYAHDVVEPIRLGLVGGGLSPADAETLMRFNVHGRPLAENLQLAGSILEAAVSGVPVPGKPATEGTSDVAPETSPSSTDPAA